MGLLGQLLGPVTVDRRFLPQHRLDLLQKDRTSVYPWKGQFSAELVELLLETHADPEHVVLDPFVGSGTTAFEAARRGLECYGAEVNPAAAEFAGMSRFACLSVSDRMTVIDTADRAIQSHLAEYLPATVFAPSARPSLDVIPAEAIRTAIQATSADDFARNFLATTVMLAMGDGDVATGAALEAAFLRNRKTVLELPTSGRPCRILMADARALPLPDSCIGLVVTSPPYINVFNYHQNYRPAMELMGWDVLSIAPSELGSNRKHRGNRFFTVVQFCMDMAMVLLEVRRVLLSSGKAIFVVGRESQIRGVAFNNGELVAYLAARGCGFEVERWQERKFTNRFGATIFEDILTLVPNAGPANLSEEFGREVGRLALTNAEPSAQTDEIRADIVQAIAKRNEIHPSPILKRRGIAPEPVSV